MVVLHAAPGDPTTSAGSGARVGFVVPRAVGPAVTRNRVRRRLRHLVPGPAGPASRWHPAGGPGAPGASGATSAQLGRALDRALDRVVPS